MFGNLLAFIGWVATNGARGIYRLGLSPEQRAAAKLRVAHPSQARKRWLRVLGFVASIVVTIYITRLSTRALERAGL